MEKLLTSKPPSSYIASASELYRRHDFKTNRASVRRWAILNQLAPDSRYKAAPKAKHSRRSPVIRCLLPDGDIYYLRHAPDPKPNAASSSNVQSSDYPSPFVRTQMSPFENYTTTLCKPVAFTSRV